jgi:hypothetical protein
MYLIHITENRYMIRLVISHHQYLKHVAVFRFCISNIWCVWRKRIGPWHIWHKSVSYIVCHDCRSVAVNSFKPLAETEYHRYLLGRAGLCPWDNRGKVNSWRPPPPSIHKNLEKKSEVLQILWQQRVYWTNGGYIARLDVSGGNKQYLQQ